MKIDFTTLCTDLQEALSKGAVHDIPEITLQIKQYLSRISNNGTGGVNISFKDISHDKDKQRLCFEIIDNYSSWLKSLRTLPLQDLCDDSKDFQILVGEIYIPLIWDRNVDPIFIDKDFKFKDQLIKFLKRYNQKNIFTYHNGTIKDVTANVEFSVYDASKYFHLLTRVIGINCQFVSDDKQETQKEFIRYIIKIISDVRTRLNTILHFNKIWQKNQIEGLSKRLKGFSQKSLINILFEKNIIIVSPGPSLEHSIQELKKFPKQKFTIIALAQSMPALKKFNVKPHFVIVVDPKDYSHVLDDWADLSDINLIAEESVHVNFINRKFKAIYTIITNKDSMGLSHAFNVEPMDLEGGTVALAACSLAANCKAKSITLVGQDLAISRSNYFVTGDLSEKKIFETSKGIFLSYVDQNGQPIGVKQEVVPVLGWSKETLYTSPEYAIYLSQFEQFSAKNKDLNLFNLSIGGANISGFENVSLESFIKKFYNEFTATERAYPAEHPDIKGLSLHLKKTKGDTTKILSYTEKLIKILSTSKRAGRKPLEKIDKIEQKIIEISKSNYDLGVIVSDAIIRLNRTIIYVKTLEENLDISLRFYHDILNAMKLHNKSVSEGLKALSSSSWVKEQAKNG
ncbi:hypothetical protein pfor_3c0318 [Rhodobacteraceae bacterium SB2]|nr:hypothetical protein pfor_3c0318 [Rhodobacteraceae bacterium SB2]